MSTKSFADLPVEVQEKIAPFLSQQDLARCLCVCRAWKALFHSHFWTHIDLDWDGDNKAWQRNVGRALKANRHLVRSIKLRLHEDDHFQSFLKQCPPVFPLLTSADLKAPFEDDYADHKVLRFANLSSEGWKRLIFRKVKDAMSILEFDKYPFEQFLRCVAPTLEVFRTYSLSLVRMREVNRLLRTALNLKELYIYGGADIVGENWLDAEAIVDTEWVCENLEVFACRIGNIPRPDITRDINSSPAEYRVREGSMQESIDLQHQMYTKLARFSKLRELTLGFPLDAEEVANDDRYKEHYQQYDCLAMTLDSGLDLLKGLRKLRKVGLVDMEVYIDGEREQAWFKEHWPNVKFEVSDEIADEENEGASAGEWETDSSGNEYSEDEE
ncbi:hypothetical protein BGW39_011205 [Mortierella sp. 14UC]|nr:hypothetical protein BGW39_011205 [Mortierella sp. 14UC]